MSFTQADMKYWTEQLAYADRAWQGAGLLEGIGGKFGMAGVASSRTPLYQYLRDYRGDQQRVLGDAVDEEDQFTGNLSFALTNTTLAMISGRDPEVIVRPKGSTLAAPDAWRRAQINQTLIQSQVREGNFKREMDRVLLCALVSPFGLLRHGYTPSLEEFVDDKGRVISRFKNQKPDFPHIRFTRPWDVRMDPLVGNFDPDGEVRWCAFRDIYYERDLKKLAGTVDGFHFPDDLTATFIPAHYQESTSIGASPDEGKMFEVWSVYDASERAWFGISPGSVKVIRDPAPWPLDWGQLPYSMLTFNEQLDSPFGIAFPQMYANEQRLYNKIWTIINALVNRTRRVVFVDSNAFTTDSSQRDNLLNPNSLQEFILCDSNPNEVVREITLGVIDPQLVGLMYQLKESIREVIGISNFDRGQRTNVETAAEAGSIAQGAAVQKSRTQSRFENTWVEVVKVSHRALMQVQDDRSFVVPIVGQENASFLTQDEVASQFVKASISDLAGEFDYSIKIDSTLPLDPGQDYAKAASFYQIAGGPQSTLVQQQAALAHLAQLANLDPTKWVVPPEQVQALAAEQEQRGASPDEKSTGDGGIGPVLAARNLQ